MSEGDIHILRSISAIINKDNVRQGVDLKAIETQMIEGGLVKQESSDIQDRFAFELQQTARKLNIPGLFSEEVTEPVVEHYEEVTPVVTHAQPAHVPSQVETYPLHTTTLEDRTMEQQRREHVHSILGSSPISLDNERMEDNKLQMLAEIDYLFELLQDADIDITRIARVTPDSTYKEVETTLRILRYKNDHARYCDMAEEGFLFGADLLGEIFNGERTFLGKYRPDLRGWGNHVNMKLRRMRHDTGQIVSQAMDQYQISPGVRMVLELLPNMFAYSNKQKESYSQPNLVYSEDASAHNRLRDI